MDIDGKVALITGAAKRIGREIALELASRGARLAVHYRSSASEAKAVAGDEGAIFQADLTDFGAIEKMFLSLEAKFGRLDILVNSASVFSPATADDATPEHWDSQMDTNAKAPFFVAQHAARLMRANGAGKIINIADVAGEVIWPGYLPYSISKAALIAVNRGLAKAYAPEIQVNAIAPGPVLFPEYYTEEQKRVAIERTLLKRAGSPRDIINAAVFLIENDYITGEVIHVDGGRHIL
jgi:NAD(P)-dependent dehydrogenase (short-subunit alcohol dehydrogenase family)